ncbi:MULTISPECIES: sugar MFS transporter [Paenibacillus]|uniref:MFS transporter n=1 Tax=Paenibacillus TaxID=44249 RepID=UPI000B869B2D|nr:MULTISPECIES: MFS transporter [Paenibacillus]MBD8836588.1 MFS transporter [Paenibacillus sp. CFBP 13594]PRA04926.1 MFS transporter [Paenibacillus sp. MYb63]PRA47729.1 MFS transporter [Paenibacillus sp. MYb67]QZN74804.1 MFS transporter [Paenibacillus sp. DR312]
MKRIFALSCGFYLLIGITSVVLGALLPVLLSHYERGYSDGGFLLFLQFLGFLVGVIVAPALTARIGRKAMLTLALICIVAAYTLLGFLPSWSVVLLLTIIVGFGSGIIEPSVGAFTIEFTENQKAVAMSKLDVFFALGALLIPAVAALFIWMDLWHLTFYTVAVLSLVLMLLWITMPRPAALYLEQAGENTVTHAAGKAQYSRKHLGLLTIFVIFFFIYMGLELGLMNFLPSILVERLQLQESVASLSVSILWIAMIIGRLFSGKIAESVNYMPFLIWSTVGTLLFTVAMVFVTGQWATYVLIFGTGLFMSGLFCIALVYANVLIPGMTERTTSILIASGGIGGAILQYVTGWSMSTGPVVNTIWILAGFCLILLLTLMVSHLWTVKNNAVRAALAQHSKEM